MTPSRLKILIATLALGITMTACWPFKKSKVKAAPPAPLPAPAQTPPPVLPEPPPLPPNEQTQGPPVALPKQEPPPAPPPQRRPSPLGPPVQPAPPPQLKPLLTPQQRQNLERLTNERIQRARTVLARLQGRSLSKAQLTVMSQVQTFIRQAEAALADDPLRASNLAERADVLAQDLLKSLR